MSRQVVEKALANSFEKCQRFVQNFRGSELSKTEFHMEELQKYRTEIYPAIRALAAIEAELTKTEASHSPKSGAAAESKEYSVQMKRKRSSSMVIDFLSSPIDQMFPISPVPDATMKLQSSPIALVVQDTAAKVPSS